MVHRKKGSPFYYLRPTVHIPGRGAVRLPERSTGARRKRDAIAIEVTIQELPLMGYVDLIEAYEAGRVSAQELHAAYRSDRLHLVRERLANEA